MPRYVAFLRAVSPMNASMPALKRAFERAGFTEVRTLLASGNLVFNARSASPAALERKAEAAMKRSLGNAFDTFVRPQEALQKLLGDDPFSAYRLPAKAKRVVTFLRRPHQAKLKFPVSVGGARILGMRGTEIFTAYVPGPRGPVFMALIDKTFGKSITTRSWDTLRKCAGA